VWLAFWMLGIDIDGVGWPACGEIDVMEHVGSQPQAVHGTLHGPGYAGVEDGIGSAHDAGIPLSAAFHVYSIDWTADRVTWRLDGAPYATLTPDAVPARGWRFDHDFYLLLGDRGHVARQRRRGPGAPGHDADRLGARAPARLRSSCSTVGDPRLVA